MMYANALLIPCPECAHEKPLMQIASGNTLSSTLWSDSKQELPMLPRLSWIQRCPECHAYFMLSRIPDSGKPENPNWKQGNSPSMDTGALPYIQLKEAFEKLHKKGFSKAEERRFREMLWHAYNDEAWRCGSEKTKKDFRAKHGESAKENLKKYQELIPKTGNGFEILHAEILRELGEFSKAKEVLDALRNNPEFKRAYSIIDKMRERANAEDASVFILY